MKINQVYTEFFQNKEAWIFTSRMEGKDVGASNNYHKISVMYKIIN
jgi:hypothetical protein